MEVRKLGSFIRHTREGFGWSQTTLAEKAGLSPSTVRKVEDGSLDIRTTTVASLLAAVGAGALVLYATSLEAPDAAAQS